MKIIPSVKAVLPVLLIVAAYAFPVSVQAQNLQDWTDANKCTNSGVATIQGLECLIANILTVAVTVIGLAGFVMLIIGSFRYLVSGGNTKGTEDARKTLTFAVLGLIVAVSAVIILNLIAAFTGVPIISNFIIPDSNTGF